MRSSLPATLLTAAMLALCACQSQEDPGEAAAQQDAEAERDAEPSEQDAYVSERDAGMAHDAADLSHHDASNSAADAAQRDDAEAAAIPARDAGAAEPSLEELMEAYRTWSPNPSEPQAIAVQIAALCRLPSAAENAFVASEHGTDFRLLQNWLNPAAKRDFDDKRTLFEVGAAIVKEKLLLESAGKYHLVARGLMIKRAAGFDPAHGDWEFGYWEPGKELRRGDEAARTCGGCHASASTDFVFLDGRWRFPVDSR